LTSPVFLDPDFLKDVEMSEIRVILHLGPKADIGLGLLRGLFA